MPSDNPDVISLVLADDHVLFRAAVLKFLSTESGMRVVADVDDGQQAFEAILLHRPHVAVLDFQMPGRTGLEVARAVRELGIGTAIVLLTMHAEEQIVQSARALGVLGYVLKDDWDTDLIAAIHACARGQSYFGPR